MQKTHADVDRAAAKRPRKKVSAPDSAPDPTLPSPEEGASRAWLTPPVGTRDFLPPEASERRALSRTLTTVFGRHGYSLVTTPPFERIDLLERVGILRASDVLQFVDADTGEIAVFRPDITPQIARLVATRMRERPPPYRLAYEGHVIRRRRGRARRQRQIAQAGLECIGLPGAEGETEIIEIAVRALEEVGLGAFFVELALVPLARQLLESVRREQRSEATDALARKDAPALRSAIQGTPQRAAETLIALVDLYGDAGVLSEAKKVLAGQDALLSSLSALDRLVASLDRRGLSERLAIDLGEVRGFGYYTGPSFSLLADGPGEPLGSGGRYDDLLGRFGHPAPGAGFALDLDHVAWALEREHPSRARAPEIDAVVHVAASEGGSIASSRGAEERARALADALRAAGLRVSSLSEPSRDAAHGWARAWGVPHVVEVRARSLILFSMAESGLSHAGQPFSDPETLAAAIRRTTLGRATASVQRTSKRSS